MSEENDSLLEGIQIMSPAEIEAAASTPAETSEEPTNNTEPTAGDNFTIGAGRTEKDITNTTEDEGETPAVDIVTPDEVPEKKETGEVSDSKKSEIYKALINEFVEKGGFEGLDKEELEGTLEELKELADKTVEKRFEKHVNQWRDGFTGAKKRFLEMEHAFNDQELAIKVAQDLEFFESINDNHIEDDVELAKNIYARSLSAKGFTQAQITEAIEDADALDKLADKAKTALPGLTQGAHKFVADSKAATEANLVAQKEANEKSFNNLMETIDNADSFIDGIKLNKIAREKLKANITTPVYTDNTGRQYNSLGHKQLLNGSGFETLINYYDSIGLFDLDKDGNFNPNLSKLKTVAKTKAVKDIDKIISREDTEVGEQYSEKTTKKTEGILDFLERATKKR